MKYFLLVLIFCCGCNYNGPDTVITGGPNVDLGLVRFEDRDYNVICYRPYNHDGIFCFKKGELK